MGKNKGFLIDTQIFIWWMEGSTNLSAEIISILQNPKQRVFLSVASIWEMVIKKSKKKLRIPADIDEGIKASGFTPLSIETSHVLAVDKLPFYHKDPFDRLLIAQAKIEDLTFITSDKRLWKYSLSLLKV